MNYGVGSFGILLIVRLASTLVWVGIPVLLVGALILWTTRKRRDTPDGNAKRTRRSRLAGLGLGALGGAITVWLAPMWLAPIVVAVGYLTGVRNGELEDRPAQTDAVRVASLQPRTARHYLPLWTVVVSIVAAVLTISAPIVVATVPPASYGPYHPFPDATWITLPGHQDAWPSPVSWIPLVVAAAGALVAGALLIRRVLRLPAASLAESARRNAARTIAGTVVGVELLALGTQVLFTADGIAVPDVIGGLDYTISRWLIWSGLALVVAGIVVWCVLAWWRRGPAGPTTTVAVSGTQT
ncbi:MAG TPA: hypothetical protein VJ914_20825 [Pseudonocardiaceae bacterium]|nr:hypothetical protein [Pseudonocardiaceae bacterium]